MRYYPTPEVGFDIVGRQEIADRLRVQPRTVSQWKWRQVLPKADFRLAGGDVWLWETIRDWARDTDRLL